MFENSLKMVLRTNPSAVLCENIHTSFDNSLSYIPQMVALSETSFWSYNACSLTHTHASRLQHTFFALCVQKVSIKLKLVFKKPSFIIIKFSTTAGNIGDWYGVLKIDVTLKGSSATV